jgi:hypothetical protein
MVLVRNDEGALQMKPLGIMRAGRREQQALGATRAETLDDPEHTSHRAEPTESTGATRWIRHRP